MACQCNFHICGFLHCFQRWPIRINKIWIRCAESRFNILSCCGECKWIFRCASISWFQAVSGSVIYRFQLAHLQVFQIIWDIPHNVCLIDLCLMVEPDHQHHPVTVRAHQLVHNLEQWFTQIQKLWLSNSSKLTVPLTNVSSQPPGIGSGPPDSGLKVFFRQSFIWDVSSHLLSA